MKVLQFIGAGKLEWQESRELRIQGDLEAIVRPVASTTCDLDRRILAGKSPFEPPFAIGHECVAEVELVGDKVRNVARGDLVVVPWHISCGMCPACRRNLPSHCEMLPGLTGYGTPLGGDWGGLFSEQVRVPFADGMLTKLPSGVDPVAVASASDNLTDVYIAVTRGMTKHPGANVLVVGGVESMGLFAVDLALAAGASYVTYVDAHEERREAACALGAKVYPAICSDFDRRYLVVIGASRDPADLGMAIRCLAPTGHLSNISMFFGDTPIPLWEMYLRDVSFSTGIPNVGPQIPKVLELAKCGHIHPERVMTVHGWDDAPEALLCDDFKPVVVRPAIFGGQAGLGGPLHL